MAPAVVAVESGGPRRFRCVGTRRRLAILDLARPRPNRVNRFARLVAGKATCLYKTGTWNHERRPRVRGLAAAGRGRNADAYATQPARRLRRMAPRRGRRRGAGLAAAAGAHDR